MSKSTEVKEHVRRGSKVKAHTRDLAPKGWGWKLWVANDANAAFALCHANAEPNLVVSVKGFEAFHKRFALLGTKHPEWVGKSAVVECLDGHVMEAQIL